MVGLGVDGILRVYDRQGRLRFLPDTLGARAGSPPAVEIEGRRALIAAADRQGNVVLHRPERTPSRLRLRTQANAMLFAFADVVGDERKDYIALSGRRLTVHAYEGGRLRRKTDRRLPIAPDTLFTLSIPDLPRQAVGTLSAHRHQIHLFDGEGRLFPGFPLAGATAFTIVDLFGDGRRIVLVGEGDGVYAYVAGTE